jgi:competence protein ComFC
VAYIICIIKSIYNHLLDTILPQTCLGCDKRGEIICNSCILKIRKTERETDGAIIACFDYRDPLIKKAIWDLKYHSRFAIGQKLGQVLYETFLEDIAEIRMYTEGEPICIIPVPLYNSRQKKRGYNQAKIISSSFCKLNKEGVLELTDDIVIKQINTEQQAKLTNRNRRLKNISGAFKVINPQKVKGRTFIIIDDVTTTGGTINEIIKILKKAGAKKVIGFAVAH